VLGKATPWRVSNGHIDQAQLQLFGAIMIDGTFPVMAMALSVVEKGELIETKTIHPVSNIFSLAIEEKAISIESRHESRSWPGAKLRS